MAEAAKVFGVSATLSHKGEDYELAPLSLDDLTRFEVWLEDRAYRKVERTRAGLSETVYQGRLDSVSRLVGAEVYRYDGPLADEASTSDAGRKFLLYLRLRRGTPSMTQALAAEIFDADPAAVLARMYPPDPNAESGTD